MTRSRIFRTITPRQMGEFVDGGTRIAPGIWVDQAGDIHFSLPELLARFKLPDTPEGRALVTSIIEDVVGEIYPQTPIVHTEVES